MATLKPKGRVEPVDAGSIVTVGDLRRRLAQVRAVWQPDPTLSDDEALPRHPTGGLAPAEAPGLLPNDVDLDTLLKKQGAPAGPPELRALWVADGLIERSVRVGPTPRPRGPATKGRKGPKPG